MSTRNLTRTIETPDSLRFSELPPPPEGMNSVAAQFWIKKTQDLSALDRLNSSMTETLASYCNLLSDMARTRKAADDAWGNEMYFRYQKAYNEACKMQLSFERELGLTPLSTRNIPQSKKKESKGFNLEK